MAQRLLEASGRHTAYPHHINSGGRAGRCLRSQPRRVQVGQRPRQAAGQVGGRQACESTHTYESQKVTFFCLEPTEVGGQWDNRLEILAKVENKRFSIEMPWITTEIQYQRSLIQALCALQTYFRIVIQPKIKYFCKFSKSFLIFMLCKFLKWMLQHFLEI